MNKFLVVAVAALVAFIILRADNMALRTDIDIIDHAVEVENYLQPYKDMMGSDYDGYKGHIYRVLTYSMHFLRGDKTYYKAIAAALVYHDIGLWTDKKLTYLEPSSDRAKEKLSSDFNEEELSLIHDIIYWHHKITPFEGNYEDIVNAVRRADWIDATRGVINQGMPDIHIANVQKQIPNAGFHKFLREIGSRIHGNDIYKIVTEMSSIFKW